MRCARSRPTHLACIHRLYRSQKRSSARHPIKRSLASTFSLRNWFHSPTLARQGPVRCRSSWFLGRCPRQCKRKLTPLSDTECSTELPRRLSRVHSVADFVFWAWVPMPEWEYVTVSLSDLPVKTRAVDVLNDAGEQGWELVTITSNNIAYLKRQVLRRRSRPRPPTATPAA